MSMDVMSLVRQNRPAPPALDGEVVRGPTGMPMGMPAGADPMNPASPTYRNRIPPPPCAICNEDHNPVKAVTGGYDHAYTHPSTLDVPLVRSVEVREDVDHTIPVVPPAPTLRVGIYVGRGDAFNLCVESAPDWETVGAWKVSAAEAKAVLPILRALEVKIVDKTAGDLTAAMTEE